MRAMSNKRAGCLGLVLLLLLLVSVAANVVLMGVAAASAGKSGGFTAAAPGHSNFNYEVVEPADKGVKDRIGVIQLRGVIASDIEGDSGASMVDELKLAMRQALEDDHIKAVVVRIDSPGGEVTASDAIYNELAALREEKPVVVHMGSVAASGGYYVACGGTHLMAHDTTITGSIGVIIQTLNYKDLLGKIGLESVVFKSGKFKDILNGARDMTDEERQYIQAMVMQTYDKFVGIVAEERGLKLEDLKAGIADGRIVSGSDAMKAGLVDGLGYVEDAYEKARELGKAPGAEVVELTPRSRLGRLLRMLGEARATPVDRALARMAPSLTSGRMYLLPSWYAQ
jgi:protease-4